MNIEDELECWGQLLKEFESLPKVRLNRTFMQIGGYPHYENVCSNILAFFFEPENEHGLQDLCYRALMKCVSEKDEALVSGDETGAEHVDVEREVNCDGKRLDLVLQSDQFVVGIENKIWHQLNNDLEAYKKEVDRRQDGNELKPIYIVLSIRQESPDHDFICITYAEFFEQLKSLLGHYSTDANPKHLLWLNDFIKTIDELQGDNMTNEAQAVFFKENYGAIQELKRQYSDYQKKLNEGVRSLRDELDDVVKKHDCKIKMWIYTKSTLVLDFSFEGGVIALDTTLNPKGWKSVLFARNESNNELRNDIVTALKKAGLVGNEKSPVLDEDVGCDRERIKERLTGLINEIVAFMDNC